MSQYNLRQYLERQADAVDALLAAHHAPARVVSGAVGPRMVRFFLDPIRETRLAAVVALERELARAMEVPAVWVRRGGTTGIWLEFPNPHQQHAGLLKLLPEVFPLPPLAAVLGLTDAGTPLLARLASESTGHVVVTGPTETGKSALLQTMALSLLLNQPAQEMLLLCIGVSLEVLAAAPHILRGHALTGGYEIQEAICSLQRDLAARERQEQDTPAVVLFIDDLAGVAAAGCGLPQRLARIIARGGDYGIHVVAATRDLQAAELADLRHVFPLRIRAMEPRLQRGDFVIAAPEAVQFHAAQVSRREIHQKIRGLNAKVIT